MALVLARSIVSVSGYDVPAASRAYRAWLQSKPPSVGAGTRAGVAGRLSKESLSNSSLMRASPLGIVGFMLPPSRRASLAREDSRLTHPNAVCADAVAAYAIAIARAVRRGEGPRAAYDAARTWAEAAAVPAVQRALAQAEDSAPPSDVEEASVLVALHTAFYALLHASSVEDGVLWAVGRGGHTDTLGAVTGALLGAVHGRPAIPDDWRRMILSCRPHRLRSLKPRPTSCWPIDVLELAERLLLVGEERAAAEGEG
jgi:ADP-ribosylglycohydrolase